MCLVSGSFVVGKGVAPCSVSFSWQCFTMWCSSVGFGPAVAGSTEGTTVGAWKRPIVATGGGGTARLRLKFSAWFAVSNPDRMGISSGKTPSFGYLLAKYWYPCKMHLQVCCSRCVLGEKKAAYSVIVYSIKVCLRCCCFF